MKRLSWYLSIIVLLCCASSMAQKEETFQGEIMDPQCAANGSHASMLKKVGLGDRDPAEAATKKACAETCLKMGGKSVLYDRESNKVYQLDNQAKVKEFAGQNVKITGTLDQAGKTIHITNVAPGS